MNLLEPWILLRLGVGFVVALLFARGAWISARVLRHFDAARATEGQLALERQAELAATFVRLGALVSVGALLFTVLAADRLSHSVRGAMCAYGVFSASPFGFPALGSSLLLAGVAGVISQLFALDAGVRGLTLVRPLALASLAIAPLALVDLALHASFLLGLDLTVVASCCSVGLDAVASATSSFAGGPRQLVATLAPVLVTVAAAAALWVAARLGPRGLAAESGLPGSQASLRARRSVVVSALLALAALPFALGAAVLEVAPHAFELPGHLCPFCLLRADVYGLGYPLFGAIFLAVVWGTSAGIAARLLPQDEPRTLVAFVRTRLRGEAMAWAVALAVGAFPVVRYALVAGAPLFPAVTAPATQP